MASDGKMGDSLFHRESQEEEQTCNLFRWYPKIVKVGLVCVEPLFYAVCRAGARCTSQSDIFKFRLNNFIVPI